MAEQKFYDTLPTGENHEVDYRDPTDVPEIDEEIKNGQIDDISRSIALWIRTKMYRRHVREAIARAIEWMSVLFHKIKDYSDETRKLSEETQDRQEELEERFDKQLAGNTDISEVIDARDSAVTRVSFPTLKRRLDFSDSLLFKYVPSGFRVVIHHNSEYQPDVKVTSYKDAIDTEENGFDTSDNFGGGTIFNVATHLSYDRKKVYVELPLAYALNGEVFIPDSKTVLIIKGNETLCFSVEGASVEKAYQEEKESEIVRIPQDLEMDVLDDDTIKLSWKRGDL